MKSTIHMQRVGLNLAGPKHTTPLKPAFIFSGHTKIGSIHTSPPKEQHATLSDASAHPAPGARSRPAQTGKQAAPELSALSLSSVLRTYFITSISSSPRLLEASTSLLRRMLNSRNPLFRIDSNPVMRALLWETFYKQFCSGETHAQVAKSTALLREQGYAGVILEYALEVLADAEGNEVEDVAVWRKGLLDTVNMSEPGDYIGLKWSGMGPAAMRRMVKKEPPTEGMEEAMNALCKAAAAKDISLLPSAEETWTLEGYYDWTFRMQRIYNMGGKSVVYNTYQCYLKQTPDNLARHLEIARNEGFTLGVKMVRGAYLGSDDRTLIHPSIEATHAAYDGIAASMIQREYNDVVRPAENSQSKDLPSINVVLATHNAESVQKAQALRRQQASRGEALTPLIYAQLQGMADEVSCTLIAAAKASADDEKAVKERVFKCTTWGPMFDCLNYLLRRAAENKDAAGRTHETRNAMRAEIWRRCKGVFGLVWL